MNIIPDFIVKAAVAADEITEQELTEEQRRKFEAYVIFICIVLLFASVIGVKLWEVIHHGGF